MTTLQPREGFNWLMVNWGAPDQVRTEHCSYCGDKFPDELQNRNFVPLILSNAEGWVAEFCDHCQTEWFGFRLMEEACSMTEEDDEVEAEDVPDLGPCCICETTTGVRNIVMVDRRAPVAGHGWGCFVCDLPSDGAYAVLCDTCKDGWVANKVKLQFACRGWPADDGRIPFDELSPEPFGHDMAKHAADD